MGKRYSRSEKIHPEGVIEPKKVISYQQIVARLDSNRDKLLDANRDTIKDFVHDARLGKTILFREKKKVGLKRILKYIQDLKKLDYYFKKPFKEITERDLERFISDLDEGILTTKRGKPYASETRVVIKKMLKKFYKWLEGDCEYYPKKVRWFDTHLEPKDFVIASKQEIDTIIDNFSGYERYAITRNKAVIRVLQDSGVRAKELLNIRMKHLLFKKENYTIRIEHQFSKTLARTITLPLSKKEIDAWLEVYKLKDNPEAQLFPVSYNYLRQIVERAGKLVNKKLTPHSLRHSSATYWCQHLTPYELCYRFGWSMSSKMPQRYIDREGLYQERAAKIVKATQIEKLKEENSSMARRLAILEDQMNKLYAKDMEEARRIVELVKQEV